MLASSNVSSYLRFWCAWLRYTHKHLAHRTLPHWGTAVFADTETLITQQPSGPTPQYLYFLKTYKNGFLLVTMLRGTMAAAKIPQVSNFPGIHENGGYHITECYTNASEDYVLNGDIDKDAEPEDKVEVGSLWSRCVHMRTDVIRANQPASPNLDSLHDAFIWRFGNFHLHVRASCKCPCFSAIVQKMLFTRSTALARWPWATEEQSQWS